MKTGRASLLKGVAIASMTATLALAQLAADAAQAGGSRSAKSDAASAAEVEEIVVTAQRRQERLHDVPISVAVLSGDELDRFTGGVNESLALVPGVKLNVTADNSSSIGIRGVTASDPRFNGSSPVAYYVDGVPFGLVKTAIVPDANAYDMERIEVLRGPQGTLYGANALNGVVRVLTHDANLNDFELKTRTSFSNTQDGEESYRADLAVSVPIVEGKLAARAVLGYNKLGGWIDNLVKEDINDGRLRNARLKLNAQPTEKMSIGLSAWLSRADYGASSIGTDADVYPGLQDQGALLDYDIYGARIGYEFAGFSLTSMTSHIDYSSDSEWDLSILGAAITDFFRTRFEADVLSQEITLNSTGGGAWRWSLGGIYRDAEDRRLQTSALFLPVAPNDNTDLSESHAIFGELTRIFMDGRFELTGGLRYFEDDVAQRENVRFCGTTCPGEPLHRAQRTFDAVTPRVILTWHPSDRLTVYSSYAEGFRSGYEQAPTIAAVAPTLPPVEADQLKNYEVGAKGSMLGGRINFDAAVYYIDWHDVQQALLVPIGGGAFFTALVNGESASGAGVDFAISTRPVTGLNLGVSFSWNDLTIDAMVQPGGPGTAVLFNEGDRLNFSPKYTAGASLGYVFPFAGTGLDAGISASANYTSKVQSRALFGPTTLNIEEGDNLLDARASLSIGSEDRWRLAAFVDNVNDTRNIPMRDAFFEAWNTRVRPRTVGLQFEYRY